MPPESDTFAPVEANIIIDRIGEKFIEWSDETPSLDEILDDITLYWFTETFPRCIYAYRPVR